MSEPTNASPEETRDEPPPTPPGWACPCSADRPDWTPANGPHARWCPEVSSAAVREDG